MLIPVEISSFAVDPAKGSPLIILREVGGGRSVAVPLDHSDANAIAMHTLQVRTDKPLTVDLVKIVVEQLGGVLYRVVVNDVREGGIFSASVIVRADAGASIKVIDCRPCDAITLAVRCGAPMFVREAVFSKLASKSGLSEEECLRIHIRSIDTAEFGRYVME
jgi:bifunctional DNase/RNase